MHKIIHNAIVIAAIASISVNVISCREDSDNLVCYAYDDVLNFAEANASLEGQFKAIWTAMNCNYPIWDYEEEHGLDWDAVYDKYTPQFRELDKKYNFQNPVPDSVVSSLYDEIFNPLHDGHLCMYLQNIHTKTRIENSINPSRNKRIERAQNNLTDKFTEFFAKIFTPSLDYYVNNGEIVEYNEESNYIYGRFKDDIFYFRLPSFNLQFAERNVGEKKEKICQVWEAWFNGIQKLHAAGTLKGVIIDVRNNPGGFANDYQYVLGALQKGDSISGKWFQTVGYLREKSGVGRLDYSILYKENYPVYDGLHANVEVPVVVLANDYSASAAEMTCLAAKQMKNGYLIGTTTYGALSPSVKANGTYTITYSGNVGDPALADSTATSFFASFFIDMPSAAFLSMDKEVIEGSGIEPNENVPMDWILYGAAKQDNQIDRALEYIRNSK